MSRDSSDPQAGAPVGGREFLTVREAAAELKVSVQTITRRFRDRPGVLVIPGPRRNETIRIPRSVLDAWIAEHSGGFSMEPRKRGASR